MKGNTCKHCVPGERRPTFKQLACVHERIRHRNNKIKEKQLAGVIVGQTERSSREEDSNGFDAPAVDKGLPCRLQKSYEGKHRPHRDKRTSQQKWARMAYVNDPSENERRNGNDAKRKLKHSVYASKRQARIFFLLIYHTAPNPARARTSTTMHQPRCARIRIMPQFARLFGDMLDTSSPFGIPIITKIKSHVCHLTGCSSLSHVKPASHDRSSRSSDIL